MAWLFFPLNVFSAGFAERGGVLEVAIIFLVVYPALRLLRVARAASIAVGIAVFAVLYWLAATLGPTTLGVVCRGGSPFGPRHRGQFGESIYDEVVLAATSLASTKTGALFVIERNIALKTIVDA